MKMESNSAEEIVVRRETWIEDDMELLCGIANAGGGCIILSSAARRTTQKMRKYRKSFETIPTRTRQALGIACTTEPIMDGTSLCLEIRIPAAQFPIDFQGDYFYYDQDKNTKVERSFFDHNTHEAKAETTTKDHSSQREDNARTTKPSNVRKNTKSDKEQHEATHRSTFKDYSIAAANRLDLTSTDEYVLKVIETNGRVTAPRIAEVLGVSESTIRRSFRKLRELGLIERIGSNKAGYWRLID